MAEQFAMFETTLGTAAVVWTEHGISGIQLPEDDAARLRVRIRRRSPRAVEAAPPANVRAAIARITELLAGTASELSHVELDMARTEPFERQVYAMARKIPFGETATYGQIARQLGDVHLARDVGQALARNPFPIVVPCHRVIASDGKLGGFSAIGGVATKQRLLELERANVAWQLPL